MGLLSHFMKDRNHSILKKAVLNIIKPLIRLLIKHDVAHSEFSELAKQAYVDVAYEHFALPKRKMTFSRVAVLTGLSRKEVVRLKDESAQDTSPPQKNYNRASRVVTGWLNDPQFLDDNSQPKILPLKSEDENTSSFSRLVERYSGDISTRAILDELLHTNIIHQLEDSHIQLNRFGYVPLGETLGQIEILSDCGQKLLASGIHNIEKKPEEPAFFQRQLSHGLPEALVETFQVFSQEKSMELLLEFNRWISDQKNGVLPSDQAVKRVGVGIYYFEEDELKRDI